MFTSIRLGRLFGIPLFVHPTFLLLPVVAAVLARSAGAGGMLFAQAVLLSVFGCVLLHELGHCLMARLFGIRTRDITLYPIGGVARLDSTGEKPFEEVCIALAGPAVNLVLVIVLMPVVVVAGLSGWLDGEPGFLPPEGAAWTEVLGRYFVLLLFANLGLMVFNLLPAFPMDGGRVLRALLSVSLGRLRATEVVVPLSFLLAIGMGLLGLLASAPGLLLIAVFVCFVGQMELNGLRRMEAEKQAEKEAARRAATIDLLFRGLPPLDQQERSEEVGVVRPGKPRGFTGHVWDRDRGTWSRWEDGRPV